MSEEQLLPPPGFRQRGPVATHTRLLLIRHGESYANARGVAGGPIGDGGLTPLGRAQATALAQRLLATGEISEASAFYTSTLPRARETGDIIRQTLGLALSSIERDDLCEINVGEGDGLDWATFVERFGAVDWDSNPNAVTAPGGESLVTFFARCRQALNDVIASHPQELVVLVAHGGVIEQAMKLYHGHDAATRLRPRIENCSMTEFEARPDGWRLLRYNDVAPLSAHALQELRNVESQV